MLTSLGFWKLLAAPVAVPLALTLVVALAGPGGVFEPHEAPPQSPGAPHGIAADVGASNPAVAGTDPAAADVPADGAADAAAAGTSLEVPGCVEALTEQATSRLELEGHVADADTPVGGADGNQNALDSQCGGAFASNASNDTRSPAEDTSQGGTGSTVPSDVGPPTDSRQGNGTNENANGNANGQENAGGKPKDQ